MLTTVKADSASFLFITTLARTGDSYPNPFLIPLKLNFLYVSCENSFISNETEKLNPPMFVIIKYEDYIAERPFIDYNLSDKTPEY